MYQSYAQPFAARLDNYMCLNAIIILSSIFTDLEELNSSTVTNVKSE